MRLDEREIGVNRVFEHIVPTVDLADFLALGQQRTIAGRREDRADPRPCRLNTRGKVALRHQFQLDRSGTIGGIEMLRVGLARKGTDDFPDPPFADQRGQAGLAIPGVVIDYGKIADAARDQRIDQLVGHARRAEAADHHGGTVENIRDRRFCARRLFVDHAILLRPFDIASVRPTCACVNR